MLQLLCTAEFDDGWTERFGKLVEMDRVGFSLDKDPDKRMGKEQIIKALQGYDIHISGYEKLSEEVLYQCPDLKLILSVRDGPEDNHPDIVQYFSSALRNTASALQQP